MGVLSRLTTVLGIAGFLAATTQSVGAQEETGNARFPSETVLQKSLEAKCLERMEELTEQEKDNAKRIAWQISPVAVRGTYIGYVAGTYTCALGTSRSAQPTGTMRYQEVTYEKSGKTLQSAEADTVRPIEINEITEIFLYRDGAWR